CKRQKSETGTNPRSETAHATVAMPEEPICSSSRIQYGLAHCRQRAADVGRNQVLRTLQVSRLPVMVIRQTQTERGRTLPLKKPADLNVPIPFAVPLRKHNDV